MTVAATPEVVRGPHRLRPDPRRVIATLFVPGQEGSVEGESRAGSVVDGIAALDDRQVSETLAATLAGFSARHRDLGAVLAEHFATVAHGISDWEALSPERRQLIGAYFTQEYAPEGAALCNPSMVVHPDQDGLGAAETRFVMSVRCIGEGHRSSIGFRTGVVRAGGCVDFDPTSRLATQGRAAPASWRRDHFRRALGPVAGKGSSVAFVLDALPATFDNDQLDDALAALGRQRLTRRDVVRTAERLRSVAAGNYRLEFPGATTIGERVLAPVAATESSGLEDARFVRLLDDDGSVTYYATYTAYDGRHIAPRLLMTNDFATFTSSQLSGQAATDKGMALFPRRVGGRYVALSRWDRATNAVVTSDDLTHWDDPVSLRRHPQPWNLVRLGNCGSPIESAAGWIVLTHGVGPMRRYVLGAELLDLDDPTRVVGSLTEPLLAPTEDERDGYVPNVVYSCGGMLHDDHLVVPYGIGDANIGVATVALDPLLDRLTSGG